MGFLPSPLRPFLWLLFFDPLYRAGAKLDENAAQSVLIAYLVEADHYNTHLLSKLVV